MNFILVIFKRSHQIGLVPTVVFAVGCLVCGALGARAVILALWEHRTLGAVIGAFIAIITALDFLVSFYLIADHIDFLLLGYRMRWVAVNEWVYEERTRNDEQRHLPCVKLITGEEYPVPCEVRIPSEAGWDAEVPSWARGRRAEIVERIAHSFGADQGGDVRFTDSENSPS